MRHESSTHGVFTVYYMWNGEYRARDIYVPKERELSPLLVKQWVEAELPSGAVVVKAIGDYSCYEYVENHVYG